MKKLIYFVVLSLLFIPTLVLADNLTFEENTLELLETDNGIIKMIYDGEETITSGTFSIYSSSNNVLLSSITGNQNVKVTTTNSKVTFKTTNPLKKGDYMINIAVDSKGASKDASITISNIKLYNGDDLIEEKNKTINIKIVDNKESALLSSITSNIAEIPFDKNTFEYNISVKNDVDKLDLVATSDNINDKVEISNQNLKEGENTITIKVTSADGSSNEYKIKVTREKEEKVKEDIKKVKIENKIDSKYILVSFIAFIIIVVDVLFIKKKKNNY